MRVGLNLVFLVPGETGGMEVYARELIPELVAAAPNARFTAFVNREAPRCERRAVGRPHPGCHRARQSPQPIRMGSRRAAAAAAASAPRRRRRWSTASPARRRSGAIPPRGHDPRPRIPPRARGAPRAAGLGMRVLVPLAAHRSHRVIVDAACTRADLHRLLRVSPAKVDVVPLGIGTRPRARRCPSPSCAHGSALASRRSCSACRPSARTRTSLRLIGALALDPAERAARCSFCRAIPPPHEQQLRAARRRRSASSDDVRFLGWVDPRRARGPVRGRDAASSSHRCSRASACPCSRRWLAACPWRAQPGARLPRSPAMRHSGSIPHPSPRSPRRSTGCSTDPHRGRAACAPRDASKPLDFSWKATAEGTLAAYARALR